METSHPATKKTKKKCGENPQSRATSDGLHREKRRVTYYSLAAKSGNFGSGGSTC